MLVNERTLVFDLEIRMADTDSRSIVMEKRFRTTDLEVKGVQATMDQVIEAYKGSKDFKNEVAKGYLEALHLGFLEC